MLKSCSASWAVFTCLEIHQTTMKPSGFGFGWGRNSSRIRIWVRVVVPVEYVTPPADYPKWRSLGADDLKAFKSNGNRKHSRQPREANLATSFWDARPSTSKQICPGRLDHILLDILLQLNAERIDRHTNLHSEAAIFKWQHLVWPINIVYEVIYHVWVHLCGPCPMTALQWSHAELAK